MAEEIGWEKPGGKTAQSAIKLILMGGLGNICFVGPLPLLVDGPSSIVADDCTGIGQGIGQQGLDIIFGVIEVVVNHQVIAVAIVLEGLPSFVAIGVAPHPAYFVEQMVVEAFLNVLGYGMMVLRDGEPADDFRRLEGLMRKM